MTDDSFCPACGSRLAAGATTCPTCGAETTATTSPTEGSTPLEPSPPAAAATPRSGAAATGANRSVPVVPVVLVAVGVVLALVAVIVPLADDGGGSTGEVFLEAAADPGPDAFTDPADPGTPSSSVVAEPVSGPVAPPPVAAAASGAAPPPGSPPYGGSGDDRVCDREQLVSFLTDQPDRAAAWGEVLGVATADIPAYVRSLTPTVLLYDTWVTNHGFAAGRATPRQSVLQAGTAVLVDAAGNPVVRCRCGNPLRPPAPPARATLVGVPWTGFDPAVLVEVDAGVTVTVSIEVVVTTTTTDAGTSTTETDQPAGTDEPGPGVSAEDRAVAEGLIAVVSECTGGGPLELVDVEPLEGVTGSYSITLDVGGTQMLFVYEPETGTITEGDRASSELLTACGVQ